MFSNADVLGLIAKGAILVGTIASIFAHDMPLKERTAVILLGGACGYAEAVCRRITG